MKKLKVAYIGTPDFSAHLLQLLLQQQFSLPIEVCVIVTQPDKLVGRKQVITASPVKLEAKKYNIPVIEDISQLEHLRFDLAILYAYGEIISEKILSIPEHGFWNIHPSLLPKYRGASPISYPLLLNDSITGVTLMRMDKLLDHGPIIDQIHYKINLDDTAQSLKEKLTIESYQILRNNLNKLLHGEIIFQEQNHSNATYTRSLTKDDGFISFDVLRDTLKGQKVDYNPEIIIDYLKKNPHVRIDSIESGFIIYNMYRALYSWPGIWTSVEVKGQQRRLKLTKLSYTSRLQIERIQLEGKNEVDFKTFNTAYHLFD